MQKTLLVILLGCCLTACVSKQKYTETLARQSTQADNIQNRQQQMIDSLRIALAEKRGANEALIETQERLQDRLDLLQLEIDGLTVSSTDQQKNLSGQLTRAEARINEKEGYILAAQAVFTESQTRLQGIEQAVTQLTADLSLAPDQVATTLGKSYLSIDLAEDLLFARGSTSRMEEAGQAVLGAIYRLFDRYPEMSIEVIGHTDNRPVNRQSLDNWQFTALRAVTVVEYLTENLGLGTNRVLAATKGEYSPRESNETEGGRTRNRRIELRVLPDRQWLVRTVQQKLEGK